MAKFIPQYEASTPEEHGRLEQQFLILIRYLSLDAKEDYKVKVSEKDGIIYLNPIDSFSRIKNGKVSVSPGRDVTSIDDHITTTVQNGSVEVSHTKEIIINGQKYVLAKYSRLSA